MRIERIEARLDEIETTLEAEDGDEAIDESTAAALDDEAETLRAERDRITASLEHFPAELLAVAGAILTVDRSGAPTAHRGLVREADAALLRGEHKGGGVGDGGEDSLDSVRSRSDDGPTPLSERLVRKLTAHRTAALQVELSRRPDVALAVTVHALALHALYDLSGVSPRAEVSMREQRGLHTHAPELVESATTKGLTEARAARRAKLPEDASRLFTMLRALTTDDLLGLLAVCVGGAVDAVTHDARETQGDELAQSLELDMRRWWTATADSYFIHVSKARIVEAVGAFAPDRVAGFDALKKAELAARAEELARDTGWLPDVFDNG